MVFRQNSVSFRTHDALPWVVAELLSGQRQCPDVELVVGALSQAGSGEDDFSQQNDLAQGSHDYDMMVIGIDENLKICVERLVCVKYGLDTRE